MVYIVITLTFMCAAIGDKCKKISPVAETVGGVGLRPAGELDIVALVDASILGVNDPHGHLGCELDVQSQPGALVIPLGRVLRLTSQILVVVFLLGDQPQNGPHSDAFAVRLRLDHVLDATGDYVAVSVQPGDLIKPRENSKKWISKMYDGGRPKKISVQMMQHAKCKIYTERK